MKTVLSEITTIGQLIESLKNKPADTSYLDIMGSIHIPREEFQRYYCWNDVHYTRNCLVKTDDFELLLICWEKGQKTPIHDFNSQEGWIHPLEGELTEERFRLKKNRLEKVSSVILGTTGFSYMTAPVAIHRYINSYEARTVSLNLYSKPIERWKEYDEKTGKTVEKRVSYDEVYEFE